MSRCRKDLNELIKRSSKLLVLVMQILKRWTILLDLAQNKEIREGGEIKVMEQTESKISQQQF